MKSLYEMRFCGAGQLGPIALQLDLREFRLVVLLPIPLCLSVTLCSTYQTLKRRGQAAPEEPADEPILSQADVQSGQT